MHIIAVDDERHALTDLEQAILNAAPGASLAAFSSPNDALEHARTTLVDVAFLDVEMGGMTGLALAAALKEINPKTNIVFVTGHSDYTVNAFSLRASGYVLKPVAPERIAEEIENLRHPVLYEPGSRIRMHCFGTFEVFVQGKPLAFSRSKSKELLAYLVDRRGAGVSAAEISAVLWDDREYTRSMQKQVQTVISHLMKTLKEQGISEVIIKRWNSIAVDPKTFACDYYAFLQGDVAAINTYTGEYMRDYSWAELTTGMLTHAKLK